MAQMANAHGAGAPFATGNPTYEKWGIASQAVVPRYFLRDHLRSVSPGSSSANGSLAPAAGPQSAAWPACLSTERSN